MLVIGGLISTVENSESNGVVGLEKVPGLNWFFKSKTETGLRKELVILLQPRIII